MGIAYLKKNGIAVALFMVFILSGAVQSNAESAEGDTPSWCNGLKGSPLGLCNIYYYGMGCDADAPDASEKACLRVADRYTQLTGEAMPHEKNQACLTVDPDDPYYNRFEGTGFDNACTADADCIVGGCSAETCTATPQVMSTCEALPSLPLGNCGCINNICQWNEGGCY